MLLVKQRLLMLLLGFALLDTLAQLLGPAACHRLLDRHLLVDGLSYVLSIWVRVSAVPGHYLVWRLVQSFRGLLLYLIYGIASHFVPSL